MIEDALLRVRREVDAAHEGDAADLAVGGRIDALDGHGDRPRGTTSADEEGLPLEARQRPHATPCVDAIASTDAGDRPVSENACDAEVGLADEVADRRVDGGVEARVRRQRREEDGDAERDAERW